MDYRKFAFYSNLTEIIGGNRDHYGYCQTRNGATRQNRNYDVRCSTNGCFRSTTGCYPTSGMSVN